MITISFLSDDKNWTNNIQAITEILLSNADSSSIFDTAFWVVITTY